MSPVSETVARGGNDGPGVRVWTDGWEWECCGAPFDVGHLVTWGLTPLSSSERVSLSQPLGHDVADTITHIETHHAYGLDDDDVQPVATRGRIESIQAVYWHSAPRLGGEETTFYPVTGTAVLEPRETAGGGREPTRDPDLWFEGYLVDIEPLDR